jgi:hypothetical protein
VAALLELIKKDRDGDSVDRDLIKHTLRIFVELGAGQIQLYQNEFEKTFLEATAAYYSRYPFLFGFSYDDWIVFHLISPSLACFFPSFLCFLLASETASWISRDSTSDYLKKAESRIQQEKKRVSTYLHESSEAPLMDVIYETVLAKPQKEVLEKESSGLMVLLRSNADSGIFFFLAPSCLFPSIAFVSVGFCFLRYFKVL